MMKLSPGTREEDRQTEDEIARKDLGLRGIPGAADTAKMTPQEDKNIPKSGEFIFSRVPVLRSTRSDRRANVEPCLSHGHRLFNRPNGRPHCISDKRITSRSLILCLFKALQNKGRPKPPLPISTRDTTYALGSFLL